MKHNINAIFLLFVINISFGQNNFDFKNAKINSFSYSLAINGNMQFSASYSIEITNTDGFEIGSLIKWDGINRQWQNIAFSWDQF